MPRVSSIKHSPIAKYLTENKVKSHVSKYTPNTVKFINKEGQILGTLTKNHDVNITQIDIELYKPKEDTPFLRQNTFITKLQRYFLSEHKFMPVNIKITKYLNDYEHNISKKDELTRGLAYNLWIEQLKESENLAIERKLFRLPQGYPIFKINKPFKYEFKSHLYYPTLPIDASKTMIKE